MGLPASRVQGVTVAIELGARLVPYSQPPPCASVPREPVRPSERTLNCGEEPTRPWLQALLASCWTRLQPADTDSALGLQGTRRPVRKVGGHCAWEESTAPGRFGHGELLEGSTGPSSVGEEVAWDPCSTFPGAWVGELLHTEGVFHSASLLHLRIVII